RALAAGATIALSAGRSYMRDGAVMGAATPVDGTGEKAPEKIVSVMRSEMRTLAKEHGLDPRIAEAMVDEEIAIDGVVEAGKLLTRTTEDAVRLRYAPAAAALDAVVGAVDAGDSVDNARHRRRPEA